MNRANSVEVYLFEEVLPAKYRTEITMNLLAIANMPFSMDAVENLFHFPETVVGDKWENWVTNPATNQYTLDSKTYLPIPQTVGHFLSDCERVWKKDLVWDSNLIKRNFKYIE